jgi:hypothetical protein
LPRTFQLCSKHFRTSSTTLTFTRRRGLCPLSIGCWTVSKTNSENIWLSVKLYRRGRKTVRTSDLKLLKWQKPRLKSSKKTSS